MDSSHQLTPTAEARTIDAVSRQGRAGIHADTGTGTPS